MDVGRSPPSASFGAFQSSFSALQPSAFLRHRPPSLGWPVVRSAPMASFYRPAPAPISARLVSPRHPRLNTRQAKIRIPVTFDVVASDSTDIGSDTRSAGRDRVHDGASRQRPLNLDPSVPGTRPEPRGQFQAETTPSSRDAYATSACCSFNSRVAARSKRRRRISDCGTGAGSSWRWAQLRQHG